MRSTRFARSSNWSTSEARENYEAMADSSSAAFHRALDDIGKCKGAADFHEWGGNMRQAMGLHALERLDVLDVARCPEPANERGAWKKANNNLLSVLFFMTEGSAHITVPAHESCRLERLEGVFRRKHEKSPSCVPDETFLQVHETRWRPR